MTTHRLRTAAILTGIAAAAAACGGGGGSRGPGLPTVADLVAAVERGTPVIAAADGYAGSTACVTCHLEQVREHQGTAHRLGLRMPGTAGVTGRAIAARRSGAGADDFKRGLDLADTPAFAAFGGAAPQLSFDRKTAFPWKVTIAGATFDIERVYGGVRRETYLLRVGDSLYPAPFDFDIEAGDYVVSEREAWYDGGGAARFASSGAAVAGIDRAQSFERRCASCHHTGFRVEFTGGEWRTGYVELGVGCESCHGPGAEHVLTNGDPARILNPRDLDNGSADGRARANAVCAQCHTRGEGAVLAGAADPVQYPWSAARAFRPGDRLETFLAETTDPVDFHGRKDNPFASTPTPTNPADDTWIAARSAWMQGNEHAAGGHDPANAGAPLCFDCHDGHERRGPSQLVERSSVAPEIRVSDADGSLCLACHAGNGSFATVSTADVDAFTRGGSPAVVDALVRHMANAGMPVDAGDVKPAKTGVGRCSSCHMVDTVEGKRNAGVDAAGFTTGGPTGGSHTMRVLWPSVSEIHGTTNSCNVCHPLTPNDDVGTILEEWRRDGADGDDAFHGHAVQRFQTGRLGDAVGAGKACVRCHTTEGFRRIVIDGDAFLESDAAARSTIVAHALPLEEGTTCAACHGEDAGGALQAGDNPLRLPLAQVCTDCHDDGVTLDDYAAAGRSPHAPQQRMLAGTSGAEIPGTAPYDQSFHATVADSCSTCHFPRAVPVAAKHTFAVEVGSCTQCHPNPQSFDLIAFGDYDGDGTHEGLQTEISALLDLLRDTILAADGAVILDGERFRRNGLAGLPGATDAVRRAAFNWESVVVDGSLGIHNPARTVRLLQQSYKELTGVDVPGADLR